MIALARQYARGLLWLSLGYFIILEAAMVAAIFYWPKFRDNTPALAKLVPSMGRKGVDQVLQNLKGPLLNLNAVQPDGTEMFVQLLGKGYTESQGHLRRFIMGNYGETVQTILAMLRTALPAIPADELFWRLHFAIGSFVFSMASSQALKDIAKADYQQDIDIADVIEHLFPFVAQGISGDGYQNEG